MVLVFCGFIVLLDTYEQRSAWGQLP